MTPREVFAAVKGYRQRADADRDRAALTGWIAGYMGRVEKLPDFEEVLAWFHPKVEAKPMSNEEVIRSMRQWVVVTGGTLSDPAMAEVAGVGVTTTEVQEPEL